MAQPVPSLSPFMTDLLLNSSAASAPPGETIDFDTTDTLHPIIQLTVILGLICSTATVAIRVFTKGFILRQFGLEDYCVIIGWIFFVAFLAECIIGTPYAGVHIWDIRIRDVFTLLHIANTVEILYNPTILFVKLSILLQYLRIFVPSRRANPGMFYGVHFVIWTNVLFYFIVLFFLIFSCSPREAIWNKLVDGQCFNVDGLLISVAAFNLVSDVMILVLPQYSIWRLQLSPRKKLGVSAIFGLGFVACIVTALRIQSAVRLVQDPDVTWNLASLAMWGIAEITLAIICSNLPLMPKFLQTARHGIRSSYGRSGHSSRRSGGSSGLSRKGSLFKESKPQSMHSISAPVAAVPWNLPHSPPPVYSADTPHKASSGGWSASPHRQSSDRRASYDFDYTHWAQVPYRSRSTSRDQSDTDVDIERDADLPALAELDSVRDGIVRTVSIDVRESCGPRHLGECVRADEENWI